MLFVAVPPVLVVPTALIALAHGAASRACSGNGPIPIVCGLLDRLCMSARRQDRM